MSALALVLALVAQDDRLDAAFRRVEQAVERNEIPGAIALFAKDGRVVRHEAYGLSDVENRVSFRKDTLCWIASITKPVTAAAVMTLVDAGKVSLDDPVEKYLPEFKGQKDKEGKPHAFTLRQILSHTSGLVTNPPTRKRDGRGPGGAVDDSWLSQSLPDIVRAVAASELQFKPGDRVVYSNSGSFVLGRVIEVVTGKPFAEYVRASVLDPLGMKDSTFAPAPSDAGRVSSIYRDVQGKRTLDYRFNPELRIVNTAPDGGLFSNPGELMKFLQMFVDGGGKGLSRAAVAEMLREQAPGRGLGWAVSDESVFSHGGSSGTFAWGNTRTRVIGILFLQYWGSDRAARVRDEFVRTVQEATR